MVDKSGNYISSDVAVRDDTVLESPVRLYGKIKIGKRVKIGQYSYVEARSSLHSDTRVGRYCSIAQNVEIGPFDHPMDRLSTSPVSYNMHLHFPQQDGLFSRRKVKREGGCVIGNDVFIGANCILKRGIVVGDGAVLQPGSIVVRDVPPYSIVEGIPAKVVQKRFDERTIQRLLETEWWNRPANVIGVLPFDDVESCLRELEAEDGAMESAPIFEASEEKLISEQVAGVRSVASAREAGQAIGGQPPDPMVQIICAKLAEAGAGSRLIATVIENGRQIFTRYDPSDEGDIAILNNKVAELCRQVEESGELSDALIKRHVLGILKNKW